MAHITIQLHANNRNRHQQHLITPLARLWVKQGHHVDFVPGLKLPGGDICIHHIATSRVPDTYIQASSSYPKRLNASVTDIRKHAWMENLLDQHSSYSGPVIVKTTLNYAGWDEVQAGLDPYAESGSRPPLAARLFAHWLPRRWKKPLNRIAGIPLFCSNHKNYRTYPSIRAVPRSVFDCKALVVQPFLPEMHDGRYCLREWYFLGPASWNRAELSDQPIFTSGTYAKELVAEPPAEVAAFRKSIGLDYGKIDYVQVDGKAVIFDVNKTIGVSNQNSPTLQLMTEALARGLEAWL